MDVRSYAAPLAQRGSIDATAGGEKADSAPKASRARRAVKRTSQAAGARRSFRDLSSGSLSAVNSVSAVSMRRSNSSSRNRTSSCRASSSASKQTGAEMVVIQYRFFRRWREQASEPARPSIPSAPERPRHHSRFKVKTGSRQNRKNVTSASNANTGMICECRAQPVVSAVKQGGPTSCARDRSCCLPPPGTHTMFNVRMSLSIILSIILATVLCMY